MEGRIELASAKIMSTDNFKTRMMQDLSPRLAACVMAQQTLLEIPRLTSLR